MTSCTSLSLILGIPKGRVFPALPGLGMWIRLIPAQVNWSFITASLISSIRFRVSELPASLSGPTVLDPRLLIILRYAANHIASSFKYPFRSLNTRVGFILQFCQCLTKRSNSLECSSCNCTTTELSRLFFVEYDLT